jgi:hypothetical protein
VKQIGIVLSAETGPATMCRSQPDGPEYFRDIDTYRGNKGIAHHITGRITCLMSCHPHFFRVETNNTENEDPLQF